MHEAGERWNKAIMGKMKMATEMVYIHSILYNKYLNIIYAI